MMVVLTFYVGALTYSIHQNALTPRCIPAKRDHVNSSLARQPGKRDEFVLCLYELSSGGRACPLVSVRDLASLKNDLP